MSLRYTVDNLKKMRAEAGLGTLSMGICALSGELVSSTPIPGSRHGEERNGTADYGGYLLGEGMTREAALYLGNLHNHFPAIAAVIETKENKADCLEATLEENQLLKEQLLRYYLPDGTFEVCWSPEEVVERRKASAIHIQVLETQLAEARNQVKDLQQQVQDLGAPVYRSVAAERERVCRIFTHTPYMIRKDVPGSFDTVGLTFETALRHALPPDPEVPHV